MKPHRPAQRQVLPAAGAVVTASDCGDRGAAAEKPDGRLEREVALHRVAVCLMEPIVSERLGLGPAMAPSSRELMQTTVAAWASSEDELEDLMAQAWELGHETVAREWSSIEPLARRYGGMRFRGPGTLPEQAMGKLLNPMPGPVKTNGAIPREPSHAVQHRAAHAIVGSALGGAPVSVGFSGFRLPTCMGDDAIVQTLLAGGVVDTLATEGSDTYFNGRPSCGCECEDLMRRYALRHLGIREADVDSAEGETLGERLRALGKAEESADYIRARGTETAALVRRVIENGFLDEEARRLSELGRVTVDPAIARERLGVQSGPPQSADELSGGQCVAE